MSELKMRCVQSHARNAALRGFFRVVLPVADDRVANRGELNSYLVLQSRHQSDSDERCGAKALLDDIAKFSASRLAVFLCS